MLLFRPSKPLRGRFLRIFGPSRPLKPRFSLERVVVFEVFIIFSSHSLFSLSSGLLLPIFGSSGHLPASSRELFFWPEGEAEKNDPPFFSHTCVLVHCRPPKWCLRNPKTTPKPPKSIPKCASKAPNLGSIEVLRCPFSVLLFNNLVLHSKN